MKQLTIALMALSLLCSCGNGKKEKAVDTTKNQTIEEPEKAPSQTVETNVPFNMETLPISMAELGDFPFLGFPDGLMAYGDPIEETDGTLYIPIKGTMTPFEGRIWKADITSLDGNGDDWSLPQFFKSYGERINGLGGTLVFDGEIDYEEYERYHDKATYMGEAGSIGYVGERILVYAIHRANGANVLVQMTGNTISGKLNVLQTAPSK
ncbi:hypothetical protein [Flagellimonas sp.]|uniref:hypothetical protein n=1 Tax=Flagellimonas sp. TaxID=2058762 RepID=UPI003BB1898E